MKIESDKRTIRGLSRRTVVVFGIVMGSAMTAGAVAFACTPNGGGAVITATPQSGNAGSSLTVSSKVIMSSSPTPTGLTPNLSGFLFRYRPPGSGTACHHSTSYGTSVSTNSNGEIIPSSFPWTYSRTITSLGSTTGTGEVCWATGNMTTAEISPSATMTVN